MAGGSYNSEQDRDQNKDSGKMPRKGPSSATRRLLYLALIGTAIVTILVIGNKSMAKPTELTWNEFLTKLNNDQVQELVIQQDGSSYHGKLRPGKVAPAGSPRSSSEFVVLRAPAWAGLSEKRKDLILNKAKGRAGDGASSGGVKLEFENTSPWWGVLPNLIFIFLLVGMVWYMMSRYRSSAGGPGGVLSFGKSRATLVSNEKIQTTFADVAGIDEAQEEINEIISFLKNPKKFQRLGGRIPKGALLIGPPGCGKTLLARAIAGEAQVPFYSISGSDFVEMFVGVGASRVRDLFLQARGNSPCVIFLDEIDAVGRRRGTGLGGGHDEREQTLNAILVEMDGFESDDKVIVLAATNRPDVLDPALLRPGRFDRHITIEPPDIKGRMEIFEIFARKIKLSSNIDFEALGRMTPTFTGANIEAMCNEAAIIAVMRGADFVEMQDLEEARDKVKWGREKRSRTMAEDERLITAVHESGHVICAVLSPESEPLHKVTIIQRGPYLGATMQLPERDQHSLSRSKLLGQMRVCFGGRVAEELICHDMTSGASSDISQATDIARRMICEWGMSENLGPINYESPSDNVFLGYELSRGRDFSDNTAQRIDAEIRSLVDITYRQAYELINEHQEELNRIKDALLEREILNKDEVDKLMRGEKLPPVIKDKKSDQDASEKSDSEENLTSSGEISGLSLSGDFGGYDKKGKGGPGYKAPDMAEEPSDTQE